uniref:Dysbindin-like n=2 Tax=Sinocyclocheilus grahami TaxID=75366 RepID=A0A672SJP6_SINGR
MLSKNDILLTTTHSVKHCGSTMVSRCQYMLETEHAQRVQDAESAQQMRMRERQRFFEEVFQHDVDVYLSSAHLQIDYKRPPLGSISSMEVNVDMLEQMDLMDISDQEALDVFFSASGEEGSLTSSLPGTYSKSIKSRMLSTSSNSTCDSQASNEDGSNTPIVQSDDEDVQEDTEMFVHCTAEQTPKCLADTFI